MASMEELPASQDGPAHGGLQSSSHLVDIELTTGMQENSTTGRIRSVFSTSASPALPALGDGMSLSQTSLGTSKWPFLWLADEKQAKETSCRCRREERHPPGSQLDQSRKKRRRFLSGSGKKGREGLGSRPEAAGDKDSHEALVQIIVEGEGAEGTCASGGIESAAKVDKNVADVDKDVAQVDKNVADVDENAPQQKQPHWRALLNSMDVWRSPVLFTQMIIMTMVVVIVVMLSFGSWYLIRNTYSGSIDKLSARLRGELLQVVEHKMLSFKDFNRLSTIVVSTALEVHLRGLNATKFSVKNFDNQLESCLWNFFKINHEHISALRYLQLDGLMAAYMETNQTVILWSNSTVPPNGSYSLKSFYQAVVDDSTGKRIGPTHAATPLQFESYETYQLPLHSERGTVGWDVLVGQQGIPILQSGVAVRSLVTGDIAGLTLVSSSLKAVSEFLGTQDLLGGSMFVALDDGRLVAVSDGVATSVTLNGVEQMINVTQVTNSYIAAAASYLETNHGLATLVSEPIHLTGIDIMGRTSYIDTLPLQFDNLKMFLVIILPRESVTGQIDKEDRHIVLFLTLVGLGVLFLGWGVIVLLFVYVARRVASRDELLRQREETERAKASSEVKSQFLANISHDLRTPMAGILGLLDIMLCDRLSAEQEANLQQMKSCAASLLGLLNNLLDLAKVEAGKMQLEVMEFDLVAELESLVDMFSVQGIGNGTEVALDLPDDFIRTVKGDPSRVRQVFANLLSNACKFTKEGHVVVRGRVVLEPPDGPGPGDAPRSPRAGERGSGRLWKQECKESKEREGKEASEGDPLPLAVRRRVTFCFEVDDTGPGIPLHKRQLVFDKFQQADASTNRTHGGTGLGLGIVRSLVQLMGGSIAVVSKEGPGALIRFDISLERIEATSEWKNDISHAEFLLPKMSSLEGGQVVLAMKDKSVGAAIAATWMEHRGLKVRRVTTWDDLLPAVRSMMRLQGRWRRRGSPDLRLPVGGSGPLQSISFPKVWGRSSQAQTPGSRPSSQRSSGVLGGTSSSLPGSGPRSGILGLGGLGSGRLGGSTRSGILGGAPGSGGLVGRPRSGRLGVCGPGSGSMSGSGMRLPGAHSFSRVHDATRNRKSGELEEEEEGEDGEASILHLVLIDVALVPNSFHFFAEELGGFLHRLQRQRMVVTWLVEPTTPAPLRRALRAAGCAVASKPLYASRMAPLLALAKARRLAPPDSSEDLEGRASKKSEAEAWAESALQSLVLPPPSLEMEGEMEGDWQEGEEDGNPAPDPCQAADGQVADENAAGDRESQLAEDWGMNAYQGGDWQASDRAAASLATANGGAPGGPPAPTGLMGAPSALLTDRQPGACSSPCGAGAGSGSFPLGMLSHMREGGGVREREDFLARGGVSGFGSYRRNGIEGPLLEDIGEGNGRGEGWGGEGRRKAEGVGEAGDRSGNGVEEDKQRPSENRHKVQLSTRQPNKPGNERGAEKSGESILVGRHVLVAEDTPLLKKVAVIRMQKLGCTVEAVDNGRQAVDAVLATYRTPGGRRFDAVLMDCQMPIMDGYGATQAIREAEKGTKFHSIIVALTAHAMTSDERKCLDAGMDAYLTKPIDPVLMAITLSRLMVPLDGTGMEEVNNAS